MTALFPKHLLLEAIAIASKLFPRNETLDLGS